MSLSIYDPGALWEIIVRSIFGPNVSRHRPTANLACALFFSHDNIHRIPSSLRTIGNYRTSFHCIVLIDWVTGSTNGPSSDSANLASTKSGPNNLSRPTMATSAPRWNRYSTRHSSSPPLPPLPTPRPRTRSIARKSPLSARTR